MPEWDDFEPVTSDWSEYEPVEEKSTDAKGRRRVELLGKIADVEKERGKTDQKLQALDLAEGITEGLTGRGLFNTPGRIMADIGGVRDTYEDPFQGNIVNIPEPSGEGALAGAGKLGARFISGLTDPNTLATLPAAANPFGAALFATDLTRHLPEQAENAGTVLGDIASTPAEKVLAVGEPALSAGMAALIARGVQPKGPRYIDIESQVKDFKGDVSEEANRAAVNLASPGTVRPTEIARFGPPETSLDAPPFELGEIPFDAARRFGTTELPPVEVLPQSGRLADFEILDEPRSLVERETRGKASFGADAPTLLRNALPIPPEVTAAAEKARASGLHQAAAAIEEMPTQATQIAEAAPSTEGAWQKGYENRTPEGVSKLDAEFQDVSTRLSEAIKTKQPVDALLKEKQLAREALSVAKGDTENTLANEWLANTHPDPVAAVESLTGTSGTKAAYEAGKKIVTREQLAKVKEIASKLESESMDAIRKAETPEEITAIQDASQRAALIKEAVEGALGLGEGQPYDKTKISIEEYNRRMAGDTPIAMEGTESPLPTKDIVQKLEDLKFGPEGEGKVFSLPHPDAIKAIGKAAWDDSIDLAIGVIKAGRAIGDAIEVAINHLKKHVSNFSDADVRANLQYVLANEAAKPTTPTAKPVPAKPAAASAPTPTPPAPGAPPVPPAPPSPTPTPTPGAPTPPARPPVSLDDVYKRFQIDPKAGPSIKDRIVQASEAFRTGFSSKFRPLNKLAEDIAKKYGGTPKDVAGIFEQLKGSSGKAEADVYRFEQDLKPIEGAEKDFNAYMFLRRSIDRLNQDVATGETRRKVAGYDLPALQAKLAQLESNLGAKLPEFQKAADAYQQHLDQALQLQVTSGRMSVPVYEAIKDGNQFYAPFKVMKWIEDTMQPEGSGRRVDTMADYTKAMEGIEDTDFKLGDMMAAGRQNIALSRILAEKNQAMQHLSELAPMDLNGDFIVKLNPGADVPRGKEAVNVLENGEKVRYAVDPSVSTAIQMMGPQSGYLIARMLGGMFRAGATSFNLPFQISNLLADIPRQALVSKYGIKGATDIVRYPMDMIESLYSTMTGNYGAKNKLFLDFLDSGAAGTTVQQYLTPDALKFEAGNQGWFKSSLNTAGKFADAIEQMSKVVGVKRAMRETGATSGKELAKNFPEAITEIRRFSGSPDFGRMGKWTDQYRLNLLYMFLNARIQGTVADVGRLTGRDGAGTAAKTWGKVGLSVGIPTAALYMLNNSKEYRDDYAKRPEQEKRNYWLIPKDTFIETDNGEKMRDYWRIPKREIAKWTGNMIESGLDFAGTHDPEGLGKFAVGMAEELSPVNIQGKNATERLESIGASLNPMVKAPLEVATGRDMYRHKTIVPDKMKKASPEQQYTDRTPEVFKALAEKMPDVAPEVFRSPLMLENMTKNLTAGLITQFLPRKPVKGRTDLENTPLLQRFQALPYTDSTEFDDKVSKFEREAADDQLNRYRTAQKIFDSTPNATPQALVKKVVAEGGDEKIAERVIDLYVANRAGVTSQERRILNLPVEQRAAYLAKELEGKDGPAKTALLKTWAQKRILTTGVAEALVKQGAQLTTPTR